MTDNEFERFMEHISDLFVSKVETTSTQLGRWKFMLADLEGTAVSYAEGMYALRALAADGQRFMPVPGEVLGKVKAQRGEGGVVAIDDKLAKRRFQQHFTTTARTYGRDLAVAFHDPHGRLKDWRPRVQGSGPSNTAGRQQLIELGALEGAGRTKDAA